MIFLNVLVMIMFRTARGWNKGTALSFCTPEERPLLDAVQEEINNQGSYLFNRIDFF